MRKKTYYSACIIPLNCGKRKKICRNFAVQGRMQVDASIDTYNKNCPRHNTAGGKKNAEFYSVTSPEISLMAETVAARFCMSLGTISLVALPSATFSMASMLRRAR